MFIKKRFLLIKPIDIDIYLKNLAFDLVIGAHGARETPVPMPNTAVKPSSGYNTWPIKAWENSTVPNYIKAFQYRKAFIF